MPCQGVRTNFSFLLSWGTLPSFHRNFPGFLCEAKKNKISAKMTSKFCSFCYNGNSITAPVSGPVQKGSIPVEQNKFDAKRAALLAAGVQMMDPSAVWVEDTVTVGKGTLLLPGTILRGSTVIGEGCEIGPNTMLVDCTVGSNVTINSSQCSESEIQDRCEIGPFAHLRPHSVVRTGSKIGAFVQLKNCDLGEGTKMAHLTYVGDADVGPGCNFGCGTVTCNYDGKHKDRTTIGSNVFIGCHTKFIPPVAVGDKAYIAAGTTITEDVPEGRFVIGRARQQVKENWKDKRN